MWYMCDNVYNFAMKYSINIMSLISFLWVHLRKNGGHRNIAVTKWFNFYSKHFLILWKTNEIFNKKDRTNKMFGQKLDFVLGEYDTTGGRSRNLSRNFPQFLEMTSNSRNLYNSWNWRQILGNFRMIERTKLLAKNSILY